MSEYAAVEAAQSIYANAATMFAIFLKIISSSLVTAYFVGSKLTTNQAVIATAPLILNRNPA